MPKVIQLVPIRFKDWTQTYLHQHEVLGDESSTHSGVSRAGVLSERLQELTALTQLGPVGVQLLRCEFVQGMNLASPLLTSCIKWEGEILVLPTDRTHSQMSPCITVIFSPYMLISPSGGWRRLLFLGSFLQFDTCVSNRCCHLLASPLV